MDSRDEIGEILARELYVGARLDPSTAPGAPLLAAAMLGQSCVRPVPANELPGNALLQLAGASWVIYVREGLSASRLNHAIAHELGSGFCAAVVTWRRTSKNCRVALQRLSACRAWRSSRRMAATAMICRG